MQHALPLPSLPKISPEVIAFSVSAMLHAVILVNFLPGWYAAPQHQSGSSLATIEVVMLRHVDESEVAAAPQSAVPATPREVAPANTEPENTQHLQATDSAIVEQQVPRPTQSRATEVSTFEKTVAEETVSEQPATAQATATTTAVALQAEQDSEPAIDHGLVPRLEAEYKAALRQAIEANKFYPRRARRLSREGRVAVEFTIDRAGVISGIGVAESSGTRVLDQAALAAVRKLAKFEPIPEAIPRERWDLTIPMSFTLL